MEHRSHRPARITFASLAITALALACAGDNSPPAATVASGEPGARIMFTPDALWGVKRLANAPARFRPGGWSSEDVLWGIVGGRLTRLDTRTGAATTLPHEAWSIHAGTGVVGWRNARGTWMLRDGGEPVLIAPAAPDSASGFDGPPTLLWSPDGERALLGWTGEWDSVFDLLERDGGRRRLRTVMDGYYGNDAALWLDSTRVLFRVVAKGPAGGAPEYRESGWRGDLAVLDVRTGAYSRVTSVPDSLFRRVAGMHPNGVLVTELGPAGVRGHAFVDPHTWRSRPAALPKGRAFASRGGAAVVLLDSTADTTTALIVAGGDTTEVGRVPLDGEPVFSPSGRRGAMRTADGVMLLEAGAPGSAILP